MTKKKPSKARAEKGRNMREAIVRAALALYSAEGVSRVKANQIAKAAGVDPPLVSYYFSDSDELFYEVVLLLLADLKIASAKWAADDSLPMDEALKRYVLGTFEWTLKNRKTARLWMYFYHLASFHPKFIAINTAIRLDGRSRISGMIYKGIVQGKFKAPKLGSVEELAREIQGFLTGQALLPVTEHVPGAMDGIEERTLARVFEWVGADSTSVI